MPQRDHERWVKQLLERAFPGLVICQHDDQSRRMMHDLDLHWPDGRIEAMEVTRAHSRAWEVLTAAAHDLLREESVIRDPAVRHSWIVTLAAQRQVRDVRRHLGRIRDELAGVLAEREAETSFGLLRDQMNCQSAAIIKLRSLGVAVAIAMPGDSPPVVFVLPPQLGEHEEMDPLPSSLINDVISENALLNADKLEQSGRSERHLFVWVDHLHPAWQAFDTTTLLEDTWELMPEGVPSLPPAVTVAWAAAEPLEPVQEAVVWRVQPPAPWEEVFRGAVTLPRHNPRSLQIITSLIRIGRNVSWSAANDTSATLEDSPGRCFM